MKTPSLLVIGDASLHKEIEDAIPGATSGRVLLHHAHDFREGVELGRLREPEIVCADLGIDPPTVRAIVAELADLCPSALLTAVYERERFASPEEENAFLIDALRSRVHDFLRRPVASADLRQVFERLETEPRAPAAETKRGFVASFVSNKGGVGKSTLAINVACSLARRHPDEVLLIDASLQLGVCQTLLDLSPPATILDAVRERDRLDGPLLERLATRHESGLRLLAAPEDAMEASDVDDESLARILNLARRRFRFVIVDTFPLLDSTVMTILDASDLAYVVLQGTVPDTLGTAHFLRVLDRLGVGATRRSIVLNRNYPKHTGRLTTADVEERLGEPITHALPYRRGLLVAQSMGEPYVLTTFSRFGYGPALRRIVDELDGISNPPTEGGAR